MHIATGQLGQKLYIHIVYSSVHVLYLKFLILNDFLTVFSFEIICMV